MQFIKLIKDNHLIIPDNNKNLSSLMTETDFLAALENGDFPIAFMDKLLICACKTELFAEYIRLGKLYEPSFEIKREIIINAAKQGSLSIILHWYNTLSFSEKDDVLIDIKLNTIAYKRELVFIYFFEKTEYHQVNLNHLTMSLIKDSIFLKCKTLLTAIESQNQDLAYYLIQNISSDSHLNYQALISKMVELENTPLLYSFITKNLHQHLCELALENVIQQEKISMIESIGTLFKTVKTLIMSTKLRTIMDQIKSGSKNDSIVQASKSLISYIELRLNIKDESNTENPENDLTRIELYIQFRTTVGFGQTLAKCHTLTEKSELLEALLFFQNPITPIPETWENSTTTTSTNDSDYIFQYSPFNRTKLLTPKILKIRNNFINEHFGNNLEEVIDDILKQLGLFKFDQDFRNFIFQKIEQIVDDQSSKNIIKLYDKARNLHTYSPFENNNEEEFVSAKSTDSTKIYSPLQDCRSPTQIGFLQNRSTSTPLLDNAVSPKPKNS